ncbi:CDC42 small effector protein 2 isoform X2 [Podarcis muralis]
MELASHAGRSWVGLAVPYQSAPLPFSGNDTLSCLLRICRAWKENDGFLFSLNSAIDGLMFSRIELTQRGYSTRGLCKILWPGYSDVGHILEYLQPKRRRRIDRSMIGEPTNFVHTAHVGSGDLFSGMNSVSSIQNQMQSKGGYGGGMSANVQMQLVDTKAG